jgi:uncharacterized OsmC-like protein
MSQITAHLGEGLAVRLSNGRHSWSADEPESAGENDSRPNPYELLLSSLATCTCLTIAHVLPVLKACNSIQLSRPTNSTIFTQMIA